MSAATIKANDFAAPSVAGANPWLIAILVALASFMETLDTTIANVALPYIAGGMGVSEMARSRMLLGVGLPLIFVPIMAASYDGIPPSKTDQASALINAARNTGGSIGVSLVSNVLTHREQFHQSRLVEQVIPSSTQYQDTLQQITNSFTAHGSSLAQAHDQAIQWIGAQVQAQASFLGYMDAFWVLMLISLSAVPLALMLRKIKLGGPVHVGH